MVPLRFDRVQTRKSAKGRIAYIGEKQDCNGAEEKQEKFDSIVHSRDLGNPPIRFRTLFGNREVLVQRYIQHQHVDPRLADKSPIRPVGGLRDQWVHLVGRNAARLGHTGRL